MAAILNMNRQLSSLLVPIYKLIFVFVLAIVIYTSFRDLKNLSLPGLLFIFGWLALWHFGTNHWKSVRLEDGILYISNYLKDIAVPVSEIAKIEASSIWQPQTVKLKLRSRTVFGNEIVFVPKGGWMNAKAYADDLRRNLALQ